MNVKMAVLGSPSLISLMVSVDVKPNLKKNWACQELRSCVNVEVAILGSLSLIVLMLGLYGRKATFKEDGSGGGGGGGGS